MSAYLAAALTVDYFTASLGSNYILAMRRLAVTIGLSDCNDDPSVGD